jgi:hypothetical protein
LSRSEQVLQAHLPPHLNTEPGVGQQAGLPRRQGGPGERHRERRSGVPDADMTACLRDPSVGRGQVQVALPG